MSCEEKKELLRHVIAAIVREYYDNNNYTTEQCVNALIALWELTCDE